jgi:hypothetical protein
MNFNYKNCIHYDYDECLMKTFSYILSIYLDDFN